MSSRRTLSIAIIASLLSAALVVAQEERQSTDDVIRISTDLVQTGVVVIDKQGRFVDGLKPEQFVLKVDGRPVTPTFFEQVTTGTVREERLERSAGAPNRDAPPETAGSSYHGRIIIFFIDDLHLSADSVKRTKKGILDFVEQEMSLEDQVAIVSPSGQIGFLQRLSDLKPVVRAAVNRLNYKPYTIRDHEQIPMTEYQALRIDQGDSAATDYFVTELFKANNFTVPGGLGPPNGGPAGQKPRQRGTTAGITRDSARRIVQERAGLIMRQSESVTAGTLSALENLMRSVSQLPGRKVVFLVSDGFFLNDRSTGYANKVTRLVNAAVHGGLVIYSLDARGLLSVTDASSNRVDPLGQLSRANVGEAAASQDGLNALAVDTGGKMFINTSLTAAVKEGLRETSNYYLLGWRPATEEQKSPNFKRLEVSIVGRPDLTVRLPRGFFLTEPKENAPSTAAADADTKEVKSKSNTVDNALVSALAAPSSRTALPTKLSVSFADVPGSGPVLTAATQMATDELGYGADEKQRAAIDVAGVVLNDQGKQAGSFRTRLTVNRLSQQPASGNASVVYSHKLPLKPGIYQVRVAARDEKSGRVGSAAQWIEIPDLSSKKLSMSTLLLGGQFVGNSSDKGGTEEVQFSVDRRFSREWQMTFLTIIYNASSPSAQPRLDSQIEILRAGQRVIASPVRPITVDGNTDSARIPYGGGVSLKSLSPGRYALKVTVTDRIANVSTSNQVLFEVE